MSLVSKYEELDRLIHQNQDEQINEVFREILNETFKLINNKIENQETLDANNPEEKAAIRAMFEYMLELWDEGAVDEAKEIGYDMVYLVDDEKLKEMFTGYVLGMLEGLSLDRFFEKYVNTEKPYLDEFFAEFDDSIDGLFIKHRDKFKKEFSKDTR
jgi:hypothetical protein